MATDDLVAFLRERLTEDGQAARAVEDHSAPWDGQWVADGNDAARTFNGHVLFYRHGGGPLKAGLVAHVVRHDPARVLADVEAKRAILRWHLEEEACSVCLDDVDGCPLFRALALPYADRPGYRPEWAPDA